MRQKSCPILIINDSNRQLQGAKYQIKQTQPRHLKAGLLPTYFTIFLSLLFSPLKPNAIFSSPTFHLASKFIWNSAHVFKAICGSLGLSLILSQSGGNKINGTITQVPLFSRVVCRFTLPRSKPGPRGECLKSDPAVWSYFEHKVPSPKWNGKTILCGFQSK